MFIKLSPIIKRVNLEVNGRWQITEIKIRLDIIAEKGSVEVDFQLSFVAQFGRNNNEV
jgi:hypothetical protein